MRKYTAPSIEELGLAINERICAQCVLPDVGIGDELIAGLTVSDINIDETVPAES